MAKLLWISDAGRPTGFGTVTHAIAERLAGEGHEIHVLAVGWDAKYPYEGPLKLYRAEAGRSRSYLGFDRTVEMVRMVEPDLVVINEDVPMMLQRLIENPYDPEQILLRSQPILAYVPIDGTGIPQKWLELPKLVNVIPYTKFAARALGVPEDNAIHHGVDPVFRSLPHEERLEIRRKFGIEDDQFVIGRVDTNSGRKDWASTWKAIDLAIENGLDPDKTVALFHTKLNDPQSGVDLSALISRGQGRYIVTNEEGWPVEDLVKLINCFDVTLSTSRGEGWGLNLAQSLACGVPVIATECSSIPEVVGPSGILVPGVAHMTNPYGVDLVLADVERMSWELIEYAKNPKFRMTARSRGLEHVKQFDWDTTAARFNRIIAAILQEAAT